MRHFAFILVLAACASEAAPSAVERAAAALRRGDRGAAYDELPAALCGGDADLLAARQLVEIWDGLGRPAAPIDRLSGCNTAPVIAPYIRGLTLAATGDGKAAVVELA